MHVEGVVRQGLVAALWLGLLAAGPAGAQQPAAVASCVACHGPGGNAAMAGTPSLAGQPKLFLENQLVLIREGLREIPVMAGVVKGLSDPDIQQLAAYFNAQPVAPAAAAAKPDLLRAGAALSAKALCGTCHLPNYHGQQQVPRLAGQREDYLLLSMKAFRDHPGPGRDTLMAATLRGFTDTELAQLAHYLAQQR